MKSFIQLENISKVFSKGSRSILALDNVNMAIQNREIISIVGPSGCGKTTILRIIAGLESPSSGTVTIEDKAPMDFSRFDGFGFVFQKPLLFPWRSVIQNLLLPIEICPPKDYKTSPRDRANSLLENLGLDGFADAYPKQLSGGMVQRVALARALMRNPRVLLMDEPFSALDEATRENLWCDFRDFWQSRDLIVILVSHSTREACFLSDRVYTMTCRPGRVKGCIKIELGLNRHKALMATQKFAKLCEDVRQSLFLE